MLTPLRAAVVQTNSGDDVAANLQAVARLLREAADAGARLAVLPENVAFFGADERAKLVHREPDGRGPLQAFFAEQARALSMTVVAGTLPLAVDGDESRVWPASLVFGPDGERMARYDKVHLFDVDVPGAEQYRESASFRPGEVRTVLAPTGAGPLGLSVCYDLRFPELFRRMAAEGATLFSVPAAFTHRTGEAGHWRVLLRARAIENLAYVLAAGQTGLHPNGRRTWGHSMIVDPWGAVLAECGDAPGIAIADIDPNHLHTLRRSFPALAHRRL